MVPVIREKPTEEQLAAEKQQAAAEEGKRSLFDTVAKQESKERKKAKAAPVFDPYGPPVVKKPQPDSHKYSTANFKISHRKLNLVGRQISGKPIDYAILQMQFSEKRVSKRIKNMLLTAKHHAMRYKRLDVSKLVVAESWVTKGPKSIKRLEPRGRGHFGIRVHPDSRMHVVLKEGKTLEEKKKAEFERKLKRIVSANAVREDKPIRNPAQMWAW
jgi:large subunit ribosomal protein L22